MENLKGAYLLIIFLPKDTKIKVGKQGEFIFPRGFYIYVGSAMNSLFGRVKRHLSKEKKKHWHIDYLLDYGKIILTILIPSKERLECKIAKKLKGEIIVRKFGSTDCNCESHLFYYKTKEELVRELENLLLIFKDYSLSILDQK